MPSFERCFHTRMGNWSTEELHGYLTLSSDKKKKAKKSLDLKLNFLITCKSRVVSCAKFG